MSDATPLYNSRVTKIYLEYLLRTYPDLDVDEILKSAGITREEVEDQGHWFTQQQVDSFQEAAVRATGDKDIAREAGRFAASSKALGIAKHYMLGLLNLTSLYLLIGKVYAVFSKAATIKGKKVSRNRVEITCTPKPGVHEKPYQCENRIGMFESVARLFTPDYADITHTSCIHDGAPCCRYVIAWQKKPFVLWKTIRNYSYLLSIVLMFAIFPFITVQSWFLVLLFCSTLAVVFSLIPEHLEKKELVNAIEVQGSMAKQIMDEMEIRHNNALLIQEIGQAISSILDIDRLTLAIAKSMKTHMEFDRGLIMLANEDNTHLVFKAGYGYGKENETLLREIKFNLTNPKSKGIFVLAFKEKKPFLINDFKEIEDELSRKSRSFAEQMHVQSMICTPIVYEDKALGILAVDNIRTKRSLTKSDVSFLMGVASQIAISIINAISYQKVQESELKYRDLVESANSIIMRRDIEGNITFFNEFAQSFFGYTEKEVAGKNFDEIIFQNHASAEHHFTSVISAFRENPDKRVTREIKETLKNGNQIWINWTYNPIFDAAGRLVEILCIGNDVTELKKAEMQKKELEASLQRARKMEALGTLAGGVAHDLNNILSGIVSYPELILMDLPPDSRLRKPIATIQKTGERAAAIVQDLLTLARRGVVSRKIINLNEIVLDYLKSAEFDSLRLNHPNVIVHQQLDGDLPNILGSPVHLNKTIMNLVTNAVESIKGEGEVRVETKNLHVDQTINGFDKISQGAYAAMSVSDTGIGISEHDVERIFEPFYTKKVMGKSGTGLGMAVVWGTIRDHNGYIDVKSREGEGTTFTLYFPVTQQKAPEVEARTPITALRGKGESVLVVDDAEEQREIAVEMLERLNYKADSVSCGEDAVTYLRGHLVDLLVLDMILAGEMDGLETYKRILEINPDQKAVIASGYSETTRVKEAQRLGAGSYLKKPYVFESFAKAIKDELDNQRTAEIKTG